MAETSIITTLIQQTPGMATLVIVVVLFLRFMEKRDALFVGQIKEVTKELAALAEFMKSHDAWEREAVESIQADQKNVITGKIKAIRAKAAK